MNWKPGKSEAMVAYRGKNAAEHYDHIRHEDGLYFDIPELEGNRLNVVDVYKHLGSVTAVSGLLKKDADHKESNFMNAYVPMAHRVFGSQDLEMHIKVALSESLLLTRLMCQRACCGA